MNNETKAESGVRLSKSKLIIGAVVFFILAIIAVRLFSHREEIESKPLATVSVGKPEIGDIAVQTSLVGTVEPGDVYYVMPKAAGEILNIYVNVGDSVNEGDPICDIDNKKSVDAAKIALDSAKIQLKTAEEAKKLAGTNLERMTALLATGDISQQSYENTKNGYDQAAAAADGAKLQLESAQLAYDTQVEFSTVTAPVSGIVESVNMSINAMASQQAQVCVISSDSANKVVFNVTDRLLSALKPGDKIQIKKQGSFYDGHLTKLETLPGKSTGLYEAQAEFAGSESIAKGAKVKVIFNSESAENVMLVDTDSIYYDGGRTYVYTLSFNDEQDINAENTSEKDASKTGGKAGLSDASATIAEGNRAGTIHKNAVTTGISDTDKTEIKDGIDKDSRVVKTWTSQLYEGALVQVLPEEAE